MTAEAARPSVRARGFALYVGVSEREAGIDPASIAATLQQRVAKLAPSSESAALIVLAPASDSDDLAAIREVLHEQGPPVVASVEPHGGLVIDTSRHAVSIDGENVQLSYTEYALLQLFIAHPGRVLSREQLHLELWGGSLPAQRTADVVVGRVRAKLEPYGSIIRTVRGAGYRFDEHPDVEIR